MRFVLVAVIAACLLSIPCHASWGTFGGEPVGSFCWVPSAPGEFALFQGNVQIGALRASDRAFFTLVDGSQWVLAACPVALPSGLPNEQAPVGVVAEKPTGVDVSKVVRDKHIVNGRECSKAEVMEAIRQAAIPSDQGKLRLVLIGQPDATDAIQNDLKGIPEAADFLVTAYTPDHWAVKDNGLAAGRPFSIAVLNPAGNVIHRQWDYVGGATALAEALRDAKAGYDPSADPDLRKSDPLKPLIEKVKAIPVAVWVFAGIVVFLVLQSRKVK